MDEDSSSSSSSSSSEDILTPMGPPSKKRGNHSKKKLKKRLKKLKKKEHKTKNKINRFMKKQHRIRQRLNKLHLREFRIKSEMQKLTGHGPMDVQQQPYNNPGHDPNPNPRPFELGFWSHHQQRHMPGGAGICYDFQKGRCTRGDGCRFSHDDDGGGGSAPVPLPSMSDNKNASPTHPSRVYALAQVGMKTLGTKDERPGDEKYSNQLAMLLEMGFTDIPLCKRLLMETKGDVKQVVLLLSGVHRE